MKTKATTPTITLISALTISVFSSFVAKAEPMVEESTLIYNNRAYVHAIQAAPNPVADTEVRDPEIIYVDKAYGQAIYSYPGNVANQHTAFNVEYVDTAYGQAIYSYPNNNPKHHLELADNSEKHNNQQIVPVAFRMRSVPVKTAWIIR